MLDPAGGKAPNYSSDHSPDRATHKEQGLWLLERLVPDTGVYNVSVTFRVDGRLSLPAAERTLAVLLRRFEVLRTVFYSGETELTKRILGPDEVTVEFEELAPGSDPDAALRDFVSRPFELHAQPLLRAGILAAPDGDVCCIVVHHLVFDAISATILLQDFVAVYDAVDAGQEAPAGLLEVVPALPESPPTEPGLAFWREHLAGFQPHSLDLGIGKRDSARPTLIGGELFHPLSEELTLAVRRLQRGLRAPEAVILYAAFYLLLIGHGAERDLVVGTPVNRRPKGNLDAIGYHVSVAPLRARAEPDLSFRQLVVQTRNTFLSAIEHASVSLDDYLAELSRNGSSWRDTFTRHMFNYLSGLSLQPFAIGGMKAENVTVFSGFTKSDLEFFVVSAPDGIIIRAVYYAEIFEPDDVRLLLQRYETLLSTLAADPEQLVGELPIWSARPEPAAVPAVLAEPAVEPDSELLAGLIALWNQLLDRDDADAQANFFTNGGHSMLAAVLAQKAGELTGVELKLADVFALPTPGELAVFIAARPLE